MSIHRILASLLFIVVINAPAIGQLSSAAEHQSVFVENKGQWNPRARFLLRTGGLDTWVTDGGVTYDLYRTASPRSEKTGASLLSSEPFEGPALASSRRTGHVVHMKFIGAAGRAFGSRPLAGHLNYVRAARPDQWVTHVARYTDAGIAGLYEGVDAVFYVDRGRPRYDLVVAPGADPSIIRIGIDGASRIDITRGGALRLETSMGAIEQRELLAYQERGGRRVPVTCSFRKESDGALSFAVGSYDRSRPLVIDPLVYSTYIGGTDYDDVLRVSLDSDRNMYLVGSTASTDYPVSAGAYLGTYGGYYDATLTKLNASGGIEYCTYLGGDDTEIGMWVTLNSSDNPVLTGTTASTNFPVTLDAIDGIGDNSEDIFVTVFDEDGVPTYSTRYGGSGRDAPEEVAVDASGTIYIAGYTWSTDYPTTSNAYDASLGGTVDACLTVIDPDAATVLFSTLVGGGVQEGFRGMAFDGDGNVVLTGGTSSSDFPVTSNAYDASYGGVNDAMLVVFDTDSWSLLYSTFFGGSLADVAWDVAVGSDGAIYVTGQTGSTNLPTTPGSFATSKSAGASIDAFVTAFESDGSGLVYSTYLGGTGGDFGYAIVLDAADNAYVTGYTTSTDYPTTSGAHARTFGGLYDAFVTRLVPSGSSLGYSTYLGGTGYDLGYGLALNDCGDIYVVGYTNSIDYPLTSDAEQSTYAGGYDGFLTRVTAGADLVPPTITVGLSPACLWPPNHSMATIAADVDVADNCGSVTYTLTSIVSDESDVGLGDGDHADDIQDEAIGTADVAFRLRAERSGEGDGRTYTITYTATDAAGNTTSGVATVLVPHDRNDKPVVFTLPHLGFASRAVPNPVTSVARIEYHLAAPAHVVVRLHDARGEVIATPVAGDREAGPQSLTLPLVEASGVPLSDGAYYYSISAGGTTETGSILLVR